MRSITLIFAACVLFCLNSFGQDFKKLSNSEVDKTTVKTAQDFASNFMNKLKNGKPYIFQDEAIDVMKNQLTEENQKWFISNLKPSLEILFLWNIQRLGLKTTVNQFKLFA